MTTWITETPSSSLWLDELRLASFPSHLALLDEPQALREAVAAEYAGPAPARSLSALLKEHGDTPAVLLHALLVAEFLHKKKSRAVHDVAFSRLPPEDLPKCRSDDAPLPRLPLTLALYLRDPENLLALEVCHRWHAQRRCAMEIAGHARKLPAPLAEIPWGCHAEGAIEDLDAPTRGRHTFHFRGAVFRPSGSEVLLAWRELADLATVRGRDGQVRAGHRDEWTILRFHRDGNRVDVTGRDLNAGRALAEALASRLWGCRVEYRPSAGRLTSEDLQSFLVRLRDPGDDTFRLLGLAAEAPALNGCPVVQVGNTGQERIEVGVQVMRRGMAYAETWSTVHQVRVGFSAGCRVIVHFPTPTDEPLALTYSDVERDKEESQAFERLFQEELGVAIHPKAARVKDRTRHYPAAPRVFGAPTWRRLLGALLDDPAPWEVNAVERLAAEGLVRCANRSVLRCGDEGLDRAAVGLDTLDCPGEVEMPWGVTDPNDPFRQEDDAEFTCSVCNHSWHPGRYRLPLVRRLRVTIHDEGAWARVIEAAGAIGEFTEELPGVASGRVEGHRSYLVWLPTAPEAWATPERAAWFPTCWVGLPGDPRLARYGARGIDLADVLGSRTAIGAALAAGRAALAPQPPEAFAAAPMLAADGARPWSGALMERPEYGVVSLDRKGVWIDGRRVADLKATGLIKLLTLLDLGARQDDKRVGERRFRTAPKLRELAPEGKRPPVETIQSWVCRGRQMIERETGDAALAEAVIEGGEAGYRLGVEFTGAGFTLGSAFGE